MPSNRRNYSQHPLTGNGSQLRVRKLQLFAIDREDRAVKIKLVAQDPNSAPQSSPTLYKTDRGSWVIQGYIVTDPEALSAIKLPEGETVVEIPDYMIPLFNNPQ